MLPPGSATRDRATSKPVTDFVARLGSSAGTRSLRTAAGLTIGFALLLISVVVQAGDAPQRLPLSEARWLLPGPQRLISLSTAPVECYKAPADAQDRIAAEIGRIAFRTPLLLGGPAAKAGLSCQSCHVNVHDNPAFHLDGLSGAPGTVDATSDLFSKTRGDGVFNPIPIPSLIERVRLRRQQGAEGQAAIARFVHGVVVDEFQGAAPTPAVFDALLAYVGSLDPSACPTPAVQPIRLQDDWQTIERGALSLQAAMDRSDTAVADFLIIALRSLLGHIHQRFELPGLKPAQTRLLDLSQELGRIREQNLNAPQDANAALKRWRDRLAGSGKLLARYESRSLYDAGQLEALLGKKGL